MLAAVFYKMKKRYLVIWQLGNNEQSKNETAVDIVVNEVNTAKEVYQRIVKSVEKETTFDNINVLGVYAL